MKVMSKAIKDKSHDILADAIAIISTRDEAYAFLEDAFTSTEIAAIAQRVNVAKMIREGEKYNQIEEKTGMSSATISRIKKCIEGGSGGYNIVLDRLEKEG